MKDGGRCWSGARQWAFVSWGVAAVWGAACGAARDVATDTDGASVDAGDAADTAPDGDVVASAGDVDVAGAGDARAVCEAFCARLHDCLDDICPFEVVGDRASYVARCAGECVERPAEVAQARELGFARCDVLAERECRTIPDLSDFCDCERSPPTAGDLTVCGQAGLLDVFWCGPVACEPGYRFAFDGTYEAFTDGD